MFTCFVAGFQDGMSGLHSVAASVLLASTALEA